MFPLDYDITKRSQVRQHRSEAEHRLHWSTFQKMYFQVPTLTKRVSVRIDISRWLGVLGKWWHERAQFVWRVSEEGSR